jgi:hypothetical protein
MEQLCRLLPQYFACTASFYSSCILSSTRITASPPGSLHPLPAVLICWQIPCRGRGVAPHEAMVNDFVWEVLCEVTRSRGTGLVLVHCTHGFNRTGSVAQHSVPSVGVRIACSSSPTCCCSQRLVLQALQLILGPHATHALPGPGFLLQAT